MKHAWIHKYRDSFPIALMCDLLEISRSGYYSLVGREPSPRAVRSQTIRQTVKRLHDESHGIYGSAKITRQMQEDEELETACRNTVAQAMREMDLKSRVSKKFVPTTTKSDPSKRPALNVLDRDFTAEAPNQKWVTDITYLKVAFGWVYLATVIDLFSRKVVGWSIGDSLATELIRDALRDAIEKRQPKRGELLHHSDRGCQYTSDSYQRTLQTLGIECSMSRKGNCYDNAVAERFFWSLKHEWSNHETYADLDEARGSVFKYIETFYNSIRLHQTLDYLSPNDYEAVNAPVLAA